MRRLAYALWYGRPRWGALAQLFLAPAALCFLLAVKLRGFGLRPIEVPGLQVVSVGNLVVGGAGKTPVVEFLARWAQRTGKKVAILSRGYGRTSVEPVEFDSTALPPPQHVGDEPLLLARRCPGVSVYVDADRVAAAQRAQAAGCDVAILDDGFQHRRLARDVDLLVWSDIPNRHVLPRGPLREPLGAIARATLVLLRDGSEPPLAGLPTAPLRFVQRRAGPAGVDRCVLVTGVARSERVRADLERAGVAVLRHFEFPDHHPFHPVELEDVRSVAASLSVPIAATEKDAERLPPGFAQLVLGLSVAPTAGLSAALSGVTGWPVEAAPSSLVD